MRFRFLFCALLWCTVPAQGESKVSLTVLHSNDLYGQLTPRAGMGGMAARARLIQQLRAVGPTLVLDAGDALGPEPLSRFDQGATMMAAMRMTGL